MFFWILFTSSSANKDVLTQDVFLHPSAFFRTFLHSVISRKVKGWNTEKISNKPHFSPYHIFTSRNVFVASQQRQSTTHQTNLTLQHLCNKSNYHNSYFMHCICENALWWIIDDRKTNNIHLSLKIYCYKNLKLKCLIKIKNN